MESVEPAARRGEPVIPTLEIHRPLRLDRFATQRYWGDEKAPGVFPPTLPEEHWRDLVGSVRQKFRTIRCAIPVRVNPGAASREFLSEITAPQSSGAIRIVIPPHVVAEAAGERGFTSICKDVSDTNEWGVEPGANRATKALPRCGNADWFRRHKHHIPATGSPADNWPRH